MRQSQGDERILQDGTSVCSVKNFSVWSLNTIPRRAFLSDISKKSTSTHGEAPLQSLVEIILYRLRVTV